MNRREKSLHITLQGTNLALTTDIRKFVNKKFKDCERALGDMNLDGVRVAVELEQTTRKHPGKRRNEQLFRAEANVSVPGRLIRVEESAMHLEQAIVKMKNTLTRNLRHWRERLIENKRHSARRVKHATAFMPYISSLEDEWEEPDVLQPAIVYQGVLEAQNASSTDIWQGIREDERDFI